MSTPEQRTRTAKATKTGPNSEDKNVIYKQERHPQTETSSGSSDVNRIMDFHHNEKCGASTGIINGGMNFNSDPKTGKTRDKKVNSDPKTGKTRDKKVNSDPITRDKKVNSDPKTGSGNDKPIMDIHENEYCGVSTGTINDGMNF